MNMNHSISTPTETGPLRAIGKKAIFCQQTVRANLGLFMLAIVCGCGDTTEVPTPERKGPTDVEMVAAMEEHYTSAVLGHDALIQGDIEAFRGRLAELDSYELPPDSPASWKPFDAQLHAAAREASRATDLAAAADVMASVVLACGSCHQGAGEGPVYPVPPANEHGQPLKAVMGKHEWATQMLWDGVTGPSGYAWDRGSEELAATRIFGEGTSISEPDDSLLEREAVLRRLGAEAKGTTSLPARAEVYGRMLVTCGACHQAVGVKLSPYKRPADPSP